MTEKDIRQGSVKDLAQTLLRNHKPDSLTDSRRAVILIGAGCSISAGIKGARDIAKVCVQKLASSYRLDFKEGDENAAYNALVKYDALRNSENSKKEISADKIDWSLVYAEFFTKHYC